MNEFIDNSWWFLKKITIQYTLDVLTSHQCQTVHCNAMWETCKV
jgi:hypothetical protein